LKETSLRQHIYGGSDGYRSSHAYLSAALSYFPSAAIAASVADLRERAARSRRMMKFGTDKVFHLDVFHLDGVNVNECV
jgi:hypothetical protein